MESNTLNSNFKICIRTLEESARKMEDNSEIELSRLIRIAIHQVAKKWVTLTEKNSLAGREARRIAVVSALKGESKKMAKDYLALLITEHNIEPDQFYSLRDEFEL